ncbi:MAG: OmpA family protein [bacterium]|nr:OmpA family protein [bacterium]
MKKLYLAFLIFSLIRLNSAAQQETKSRKELRGDKYAFVYSFDKAIHIYKHVHHLTVDGKRNLARSYYNINQFTNAEAAYANLVKDTFQIKPNDYYVYAMALKSNAKYSEAEVMMDKYKSLKPYDASSRSFEENCKSLPVLVTDQGKYRIEHLNLNSEADDFGTCFLKDKVVFASSRVIKETNEDRYNWNNKPFLDMYISEVEGPQLGEPVIFSKAMNTKRHDGTAAYNRVGTEMAYTSNGHTNTENEHIIGLQMWMSSKKDSVWSTPSPFSLNNENYSVGQPCFLADGKTMYFTSDMPGGYGGADLYKTQKDEAGNWSKPENLGGKINTERDEMFPFFTEKNDILLFTSNGHFGLGGLDIFMCATSGTVLGKVYNAGAPLNTQYDDFAVIVNDQSNKGYYSSNRISGCGGDDIYSVAFLKGLNAGKKITGVAKDKNSKVLPNTFITLLDGDGIILDTVTTGADAGYFFFVDSDKNFRLTGRKLTYNDGRTDLNSFGSEFIIEADVILTMPPKREEIIAAKLVIGADLGKILELKSIYFDLNKYDIRPDAEIELDKIVQIMNVYPNMIIELGSHTDCRNSIAYNQKLSDRRAKASAKYVQRGITSEGRVFGKGYGEKKLVNGCSCEKKVVSKCTEEEHALNRRTEFIILKK